MLLSYAREPLPPQPGRPRRQDYEHQRGGTRNLFLFCEPLAGWRHVAITQRRTMQDFARQIQWLVDTAYPNTPVVRVVLDNPVSRTGRALNLHRMASLYETFPAAEARRIVKRLEFHHTPQARQLAQHSRDQILRIDTRLPPATPSRRCGPGSNQAPSPLSLQFLD